MNITSMVASMKLFELCPFNGTLHSFARPFVAGVFFGDMWETTTVGGACTREEGGSWSGGREK
jgi:hypothetical protein